MDDSMVSVRANQSGMEETFWKHFNQGDLVVVVSRFLLVIIS